MIYHFFLSKLDFVKKTLITKQNFVFSSRVHDPSLTEPPADLQVSPWQHRYVEQDFWDWATKIGRASLLFVAQGQAALVMCARFHSRMTSHGSLSSPPLHHGYQFLCVEAVVQRCSFSGEPGELLHSSSSSFRYEHKEIQAVFPALTLSDVSSRTPACPSRRYRSSWNKRCTFNSAKCFTCWKLQVVFWSSLKDKTT